MLITLALAPQRVLDLEQFRSDAREWMWIRDCRWYYDSRQSVEAPGSFSSRLMVIHAQIPPPPGRLRISLPFFQYPPFDSIAVYSLLPLLGCPFLCTRTYHLLVAPSFSTCHLIPTNTLETQNARDAHEIEVIEVSEEQSQ